MTWQAITHGTEANRAEDAIRSIARDLSSLRYDSSIDAAEYSDLAMFYSYLHTGLGDEPFGQLSDEFLELATKSLSASTNNRPHFFDGLANIAWVNEHVSGTPHQKAAKGQVLQEDGNEEITDFLLGHLRLSPWEGHYDLIQGLVGYAVYFREGLQFPKNREGLTLVVQQLEALQDENGVWFSPPELLSDYQSKAFPNGCFDLGIAHGIPGILVVLALAASENIERTSAIRMADDLVPWLLQRRTEKVGMTFPSMWSSESFDSARSAWCYGDPGVAMALLLASQLLHREQWRETALAVLRQSVQVPQEGSGVVDPGLCHGSAGLAHIYNRAYQYSGDEAFRQGADFWIRETLARRQTAGFGGYQAYVVRPDNLGSHYADCSRFLEGSLGIGLSLLAAISTVAPQWDRRLLLSY